MIKHVTSQLFFVRADKGLNFVSHLMDDLCRQLGIKKFRTTTYHPQTDRAVEKFNRTLGDMLTALGANELAEWDKHLDYCVAHYNRTLHSSTGETPFYL